MKVLVVRLGAMGDIVHTVPAVAALASALPGVQIDWLVERRHRPVLEAFALTVRPVEIDPSRSWIETVRIVRALRTRAYDVALDFQGLLKSAVLARLSGAGRVAGFARAALREPMAAAFYTETVDPGAGGHVIHKNFALARHLGVMDDAIGLPLAAPADALPHAPYAVLNPGAGWPNKQWDPSRFGALAAWVRQTHGVPSLVTWGPGEEALAARVIAASDGAATMAPATTPAGLLALMRAATIVVSGDTGPIHLAAAASAPIVGIYGPTDPARNGPWSPRDVTVSRFSVCECHHKRRCHRATRCLDDIAVSDVTAAVSRRLADRQVS